MIHLCYFPCLCYGPPLNPNHCRSKSFFSFLTLPKMGMHHIDIFNLTPHKHPSTIPILSTYQFLIGPSLTTVISHSKGVIHSFGYIMHSIIQCGAILYKVAHKKARLACVMSLISLPVLLLLDLLEIGISNVKMRDIDP